jgi:S-DNA-T family DNA segregation ATPase FtsK/SpoIIIE
VPLAAGPTIRIRSLPAAVRQADLTSCLADHHGQGSDVPEPTGRSVCCLLGVGGDDARPIWTELFLDHARFLISGPPLSGRSTAAVVIARQALQAGFTLLIAAPPRSLLAAWASGEGIDILGPDSPVGQGAGYDAFAGQVVLIDDAEQFNDTASGTWLTELIASSPATVITAARSDDLAVTYRGPAAAVRRRRTGLLLQPSPADGDLLGIRVGPRRMPSPPGRGLLVTDALRTIAPDGLAVQVAT